MPPSDTLLPPMPASEREARIERAGHVFVEWYSEGLLGTGYSLAPGEGGVLEWLVAEHIRLTAEVARLQAERPADEGAVAAERERIVAAIKKDGASVLQDAPPNSYATGYRMACENAVVIIRRIPAPPAKRAEPAS